jgi:hypothetical protein
MSKTLGIFCLALGTALSCAAGGPKGGGGGGANATFSLACGRGVTATLDQLTVYDDVPSNATKSSLCGGQPSMTCSSNTTTLVCVGNDPVNGAFTVKGYTTPNTTGAPPWGLNLTDSKGNHQTCIAEGTVPSKFSCTTILGKGVTLSVVNSK